MLSETRPDLSHLCSNFLLSRFAAAISSLYQGALGLTVTRRWQSGACLSASSVKVELYCVTRAETLSAGVVTKADWATSNVKSLISTFFHFRYETCLDRKDGLSAAKLKITELWSETTCPWTDTLLTMFSVTPVMIRSSTWPWTWVGLVTWFCNPKEVSKSKNWHIYWILLKNDITPTLPFGFSWSIGDVWLYPFKSFLLSIGWASMNYTYGYSKVSFHLTRRSVKDSTPSQLGSDNANISWVWPFHTVIRFMVNCIMPPHLGPSCDFLDFIFLTQAYNGKFQSYTERRKIGQAWPFYIAICFMVQRIIPPNIRPIAENVVPRTWS